MRKRHHFLSYFQKHLDVQMHEADFSGKNVIITASFQRISKFCHLGSLGGQRGAGVHPGAVPCHLVGRARGVPRHVRGAHCRPHWGSCPPACHAWCAWCRRSQVRLDVRCVTICLLAVNFAGGGERVIEHSSKLGSMLYEQDSYQLFLSRNTPLLGLSGTL